MSDSLTAGALILFCALDDYACVYGLKESVYTSPQISFTAIKQQYNDSCIQKDRK